MLSLRIIRAEVSGLVIHVCKVNVQAVFFKMYLSFEIVIKLLFHGTQHV